MVIAGAASRISVTISTHLVHTNTSALSPRLCPTSLPCSLVHAIINSIQWLGTKPSRSRTMTSLAGGSNRRSTNRCTRSPSQRPPWPPSPPPRPPLPPAQTPPTPVLSLLTAQKCPPSRPPPPSRRSSTPAHPSSAPIIPGETTTSASASEPCPCPGRATRRRPAPPPPRGTARCRPALPAQSRRQDTMSLR